jgi:hypothetical protein
MKSHNVHFPIKFNLNVGTIPKYLSLSSKMQFGTKMFIDVLIV